MRQRSTGIFQGDLEVGRRPLVKVLHRLSPKAPGRTIANDPVARNGDRVSGCELRENKSRPILPAAQGALRFFAVFP